MKRVGNNPFDEAIRRKFEDFRPSVPDGLWENIASRLEETQDRVVPLRPERRRQRQWIAVAAVALLVCGAAIWFNRPVEVTYLRGEAPAGAAMTAGETQEGMKLAASDTGAAPTGSETAVQDARVPETERIDLAGLKQLFGRKRRVGEQDRKEPTDTEQPQVDRHVPDAGVQLAAQVVPVEMTPALTAGPVTSETQHEPMAQPVPPVSEMTMELAGVPDIQRPVPLEDEAEVLLASADPESTGKSPFGISKLLNYVVGAVDQREEKIVTFSTNEEGILKMDFNLGLARNRKKQSK